MPGCVRKIVCHDIHVVGLAMRNTSSDRFTGIELDYASDERVH